MGRSGVDLVEEVSRNLRPAPRIRRAADAIVANLTAGGAAFNGIHLRLERDAGFKDLVGGEEVGAKSESTLKPKPRFVTYTPPDLDLAMTQPWSLPNHRTQPNP